MTVDCDRIMLKVDMESEQLKSLPICSNSDSNHSKFFTFIFYYFLHLFKLSFGHMYSAQVPGHVTGENRLNLGQASNAYS